MRILLFKRNTPGVELGDEVIANEVSTLGSSEIRRYTMGMLVVDSFVHIAYVLRVVMQGMSKFTKEFEQIRSFENWVSSEILGGRKLRVELGAVEDVLGNKFELALDTYRHYQRFVYEPSEPRLLSWVKSWVLGVENGRLYQPIAYRADLEQLPSGILKPLLGRIELVREKGTL